MDDAPVKDDGSEKAPVLVPRDDRVGVADAEGLDRLRPRASKARWEAPGKRLGLDELRDREDLEDEEPHDQENEEGRRGEVFVETSQFFTTREESGARRLS